MNKKTYGIFFFVFLCYFAHAQKSLHDFGFTRNQNIIVQDSSSDYKNPWAGGMNACHFSSIDLNLDGIKDLFVYDRASSRILTFINHGTNDSIDYVYAPEFIKKFPKMHDWVELVDYNNDGKEDIFCYGVGGIEVYKNVTNPVDSLKFSLVTIQLNSLQGLYYTNILVTQVDYPVISDLDGDGDKDILTFWGLGSYIEYHLNMSMELYGNADSLNYVLEQPCWGNVAEDVNNNNINLNITCPFKSVGLLDVLHENFNKKEIKHTGSTLLALDLNGDNLKDLIVGDVTFSGLISLTNNGLPDSANIVSKDTIFPSYDTPVKLSSFPVPCFLDVNNDNKRDLIVSPFEQSVTAAENFKSVWYYKNIGTDLSPDFHYQKSNFLQDEMIDVGAGAYPVLYDYDGDSLLDLFIGNYGYFDTSYFNGGNLVTEITSKIALYHNTGTKNNPMFTLLTRDFAGLSAKHLLSIYPTFGDLDGDGDADMIIGDSKGNIYRYENIAGVGNPMNIIFHDSIPMNVGKFSTPQLIDLDRDSLLDLVIGEKNGNLNYYRNTGTKFNPIFTHITDSLGHIDVIDHSWSNYGYSVPCFFEDSIGRYKLFVGSESGYIFYYKNIDDSIAGHFTLFDNKLAGLYEGIHSAVAVAQLNNDNYLEMIVGNYSGGVSYFDGSQPLPTSIAKVPDAESFDYALFPNPAENFITIDLDQIKTNYSVNIQIVDIVGRSIFKTEVKEKLPLTIDTHLFSNGIYICIASLKSNKQITEKIIKKFIINH